MSDVETRPAAEWHEDALALIEQRRHADAFTMLGALVRRHPEFQIAHNDLGVLCFTLGLKAEARDFLERAYALDPSHAPTRDNLADVYRSLGRSDLADRLCPAASPRSDAPAPFRAPRLRVDFIAYHDLQAQAGESAFAAMAEHFDCRWRIGPGQQPSGAEVAIMLDHCGFQPHLAKSTAGYRQIVQMSHDFADLAIYFQEAPFLRQCDLVLTPSPLHTEIAQQALGPAALIRTVGWPKFDRLAIAPEHAETAARLHALPERLTLLYAPTSAWTFEWIDVLPRLRELPINLIVKNHIYVNPGQPLPPGNEEKYRAALASAEAMEAYVRTAALPHWIVAPRRMNSCSLFPFCDVALSDTSSLLAEFMPFGLAIETGRVDLDPANQHPDVSPIFADVLFLETPALQRLLSSVSDLEQLVSAYKTDVRPGEPTALAGAGQRAAQAIDDCLAAAYAPRGVA